MLKENDFNKKILNKLIDKYENGWRNNSLNPRLYIDRYDKIFDEYNSPTGFKIIPTIDSYLSNLEEYKFIHIYKDNNTFRIYLNTDYVDEIYLFLDRKNIVTEYKNNLENISNLINNCKNKTSIMYLNYLQSKLINRQKVDRDFKNIKELKKTISGIEAIENNEKEILLRNFSLSIFNDSKYLENNEDKFLNIFNEFSMNRYEDFMDLLSKHNILKNPKYSYIKNGIEISINEETINLNKFGYSLNLTSEEILKMQIKNIFVKKVITIENLTTYNYFNNDEYCIIYLAGYHNSDKEKIIKKLYDFSPDLEFNHFGDIDVGGLKILLDLKNKTNVNFKNYLMDLNTLNKYEKYCKNLTENDKYELNQMLNNEQYKEFYNLIVYMLKFNVKLEQEAIDLSDFI